MMSVSFMMRRSLPSILTSVPDHLPNRTLSPVFTSSGIDLAGFVAAAGADGDDLALHRLFLGGFGDDDATLGLGALLQRASQQRGRAKDGISWEMLLRTLFLMDLLG